MKNFFSKYIFINLSFSFTITFTIEKIRVPAEQCGRKKKAEAAYVISAIFLRTGKSHV